MFRLERVQAELGDTQPLCMQFMHQATRLPTNPPNLRPEKVKFAEGHWDFLKTGTGLRLVRSQGLASQDPTGPRA